VCLHRSFLFWICSRWCRCWRACSSKAANTSICACIARVAARFSAQSAATAASFLARSAAIAARASASGFLATRVLPGAIGHSILRTLVNPRYIPLSNSQDPELVLLSSHFCYPSGIDPWSFVISTFEKLNSPDSGKGWSALYHPQGG